MKKLLSTILIVLLFPLGVASVKAEDQVCVQNYGQPVVCGVKHDIVQYKTGVADINFGFVGFGLITISGILYLISKKQIVRI